MYCGCLTNNRGELCSRVTEIWDEVCEVCEVCEARKMEELKDELSDVMFGLGRLLGYLRGKVSVYGYGEIDCPPRRQYPLLFL